MNALPYTPAREEARVDALDPPALLPMPFDLMWRVFERRDGLQLALEYRRTLFTEARARAWLRQRQHRLRRRKREREARAIGLLHDAARERLQRSGERRRIRVPRAGVTLDAKGCVVADPATCATTTPGCANTSTCSGSSCCGLGAKDCLDNNATVSAAASLRA